MNEEIQETKNFFKSHHIPLSDLWLESCINWFHEQQSGANYLKKELCSKVYEQWLLLDLRDVEVPQLIPNELTEKKIVINRTLSLQLMSVIDISKPKLWQLQKMRNLHVLNDNIEEGEEGFRNNNNVNGKRVLQLRLTDGIHEIMGLEYKTIPVLNLGLTPGMKIRVIPPVMVRRGQLMLEQHNIKLLGGEVDDIIMSNSAENILERALNLPERVNPRQNEEPHNLIDNIENINGERENRIQNRNIDIINNRRGGNSTQITDLNDSRHGMSEEEQEELRIAAEIDMLMEVEREMKTSKMIASVTPVIKSHNNTKQDAKHEDEDIFTSIDLDQHLDKIEEQMHRLSGEKQFTIADLIEKWRNKAYGKYRVHARFKSIVQKLTFAESWILQIAIIDDSGELNVFVHSNIISDLIGYSPAVMTELKKNVQAKNQEAISTVMKALDGLRGKLLKLNCLMEIEIRSTPNDEAPLITALL